MAMYDYVWLYMAMYVWKCMYGNVCVVMYVWRCVAMYGYVCMAIMYVWPCSELRTHCSTCRMDEHFMHKASTPFHTVLGRFSYHFPA